MRCRLLIALVLCAACGKNEKPPPKKNVNLTQESGPSSKQPPGESARVFFAQVCALCHGADGSGTGPAAAQLNPKPRNYTDPAWQASVTDAEIKKIIVGGGQAVGKSPSMPANPALQDNPAMLDGLVQVIRGFAKK
jgi:cytochrome c553